MANVPYQAAARSRDMADKLRKLVSATLPSVVETNDANGNPVITASQDNTPAAGEKVVVIRTQNIDVSYSLDIFGNASNQFGPLRIQICTEANVSSGSGADILTPVELLPILALTSLTGAALEWHQTANGTIPSTAAIDAGTNLKATWRGPDMYWNVLNAG